MCQGSLIILGYGRLSSFIILKNSSCRHFSCLLPCVWCFLLKLVWSAMVLWNKIKHQKCWWAICSSFRGSLLSSFTKNTMTGWEEISSYKSQSFLLHCDQQPFFVLKPSKLFPSIRNRQNKWIPTKVWSSKSLGAVFSLGCPSTPILVANEGW